MDFQYGFLVFFFCILYIGCLFLAVCGLYALFKGLTADISERKRKIKNNRK